MGIRENGYNHASSMEFVRETLLSLELPKLRQGPSPRKYECTWLGPPEGVMKINSDGALAVQVGVAGGGSYK